VDSLRGLAEVCFLQSEYRSRVTAYKYANFTAQDKARRLQRLKELKKQAGEANDDLDDGLLQ
jgi:hypothetical protein